MDSATIFVPENQEVERIDKALITTPEFAKIAGVTPNTIYSWHFRHYVPSHLWIQVGVKRYYKRSKILEWLGVRD